MIRKFIIPILLVLVVIAGVYFYVDSKQIDSPADINTLEQTEQSTETETGFDKTQYSLTEPDSLWVIVNKKNALPIDYEPELVVPDVQLRLSAGEQQMQISSAISKQVEEMFAGAQADGVTLVFGSGYRSASLQKQFYDSYVASSGVSEADTFSARPGHSEHQTGLAFDVTSVSQECHLQECFSDTPEGKWLAENGYKYGFVIRYPNGKGAITGYQYEPWHMRFVGKELAEQIHSSNQTLEEFFELEPANSYD